MNIKEIIDRERCTILPRNQHARSILVAHNAALDRIEAAMTKRIAELEDKLDDEKQFNDRCRRDEEAAIKLMMDAEADLVGMVHRIAELEAQVPKIAKPVDLPERMTPDEVPIFNRDFDD